MSSTSFAINKVIRAGAGAGKTYNLTHEVARYALDFFHREKRWPQLIVTTFTRKATQELKERLMAMALSDFPDLVPFVSSQQYLKIHTIHGVLDLFLKEYGHLIDLRSDFGYWTETEALFQSKKVLKGLVEAEGREVMQLLSLFSFQQIHQLLRSASDCDTEVLKAAKLEDFMQLLHIELSDLKIRCDEFLRKIPTCHLPEKWKEMEQLLQQIAPSLTVVNWKSPQVALTAIEKFELRGLKSKKFPDSEVISEDFKNLVKDLRDLEKPYMQISAMENLAFYNQCFEKLLKEYKQKFQEVKKSLSKIEMNDLEVFALQVVRRFQKPMEHWVQQQDYWFVDEFQDTSPRQLEILESLIGNKSFYLVGDPQQSIYLFRGARSEVFSEKFQKVSELGGEFIHLDKNYRSQPQLLKFINRCAEVLGENFASMDSAEKTTSQVSEDVEIFRGFEREEGLSVRQQELEYLKTSILYLAGQGIPFDQMAILVRKNRDLEEIGQFLSNQKIPLHLHSSGLFWQRREVQSAISLLKFLLNPHDDENLMILLRSPVMTVLDRQLCEASYGRKSSLWAVVKALCAEGKWGRSGVLLQQALLDLQKLGVAITYERLIQDLGFFDLHLEYDRTGRAEGNLWKFIYLLKSFERERGAQFIQFVNDCERAILNESSVDSPGSVEANKVNVMTVHASKGLQFPYVFLPFLGQKPYLENQLPFSINEADKKWCLRTPSDETETKSSSSLFEKNVLALHHERILAEDRRVLYVAMTRAEQKLFLSWENSFGKDSWASFLAQIAETTNPAGGYKLKVISSEEKGQPPSSSSLALVEERKSVIPPVYRTLDVNDCVVESRSVTRMVAKGNKSYRDAFIKKQQGILFHRLLEVIKYPTQKDLSALIESWFPDKQEEVVSALNYTLQLQEPPLIQLMKEGQVEWAFRSKTPEQWIDGQVDLWSVYQDTLWVVDYKSGEKILMDKSFAQLEIYSRALCDHLHWTGPIKTAVIYPFLQTSFVRQL